VEFPPELISFLRASSHITVLTGAGVSQESGLRTFRNAQVGLWAQYRPEDLATPEAFLANPKLVWDWYKLRRERADSVEPNPGHYALAELAGLIPRLSLLTQNVDGLHTRAGNAGVIELHGSIRKVRCFDCGIYAESWLDDSQNVPKCPHCGGFLRPDVVWFGESLPRPALEAAVEASRTCQAFFSIGTSGLVQPAASLAHAARNRGAVIIEINLEPTPLTPKCDYAFHGKSGEILPELVRVVWRDFLSTK
jgi:NAD-dependent deacetylase